MKRYLITLLSLSIASLACAQLSPDVIAKRERHKNLVVKEWNKDAKGNNGWLDHLTRYDDQGRKIEEVEYATYGQVSRVLFYYENEAVGKVTKEEVFDARDKITRIRLYEYNADGTRKLQYNYLPNGKLYSVKSFEYTFVEAGK